MLDQQISFHKDVTDIAALAAIHQQRHRIMNRKLTGRALTDHHHVRSLAHLQAAKLVGLTERLGSTERRNLQRLRGGQGFGGDAGLLRLTGEVDLDEDLLRAGEGARAGGEAVTVA